jgi:hypothetical protein
VCDEKDVIFTWVCRSKPPLITSLWPVKLLVMICLDLCGETEIASCGDAELTLDHQSKQNQCIRLLLCSAMSHDAVRLTVYK